MALVFKDAVRSKRQVNKSASLRDLLNSCVAEYNRKATVKAIFQDLIRKKIDVEGLEK